MQARIREKKRSWIMLDAESDLRNMGIKTREQKLWTQQNGHLS
jgi:hypothetical protein